MFISGELLYLHVHILYTYIHIYILQDNPKNTQEVVKSVNTGGIKLDFIGPIIRKEALFNIYSKL